MNSISVIIMLYRLDISIMVCWLNWLMIMFVSGDSSMLGMICNVIERLNSSVDLVCWNIYIFSVKLFNWVLMMEMVCFDYMIRNFFNFVDI